MESLTRKPPDPALVYRTYSAEVQSAGEWGAFTRTASHYHKPDGSPYSSEWARKTIKKYLDDRAACLAPTKPPDELAYVDPPDAYPTPVPLCEPPQHDAPTKAVLPPTEVPAIMESAPVQPSEQQPPTISNSQPSELENRPVADPYRLQARAVMPLAYRRLQAEASRPLIRSSLDEDRAWGWWLGLLGSVVLIAPVYWGAWWPAIIAIAVGWCARARRWAW